MVDALLSFPLRVAALPSPVELLRLRAAREALLGECRRLEAERTHFLGHLHAEGRTTPSTAAGRAAWARLREARWRCETELECVQLELLGLEAQRRAFLAAPCRVGAAFPGGAGRELQGRVGALLCELAARRESLAEEALRGESRWCARFEGVAHGR